MNPTSERNKFHEILDKFVELFNKDDLVYDIGKSNIYEYKYLFKGEYKTIDINPKKNPDIVCNVEKDTITPRPNGIICMGVIEQCDNPINLIDSIGELLQPDGLVLFGFISIGYPLYDIDYFRLTPNGVKKVLKDYDVIDEQTVYRNSIPSYIFVIGRKKNE